MAKRGRPPFDDGADGKILAEIWSLYPEIKTKRGIQNKFYESKAISVIHKMEDVEFIWHYEKNIVKSSILMQIGKFGNPEIMRQIARQICDLAKTEKRTTKE